MKTKNKSRPDLEDMKVKKMPFQKKSQKTLIKMIMKREGNCVENSKKLNT